MSLSAGTRLGPYEIVAPLGAGGMGEVYRARDPRLGREVAVKVLPELVAKDPERLRRFEHEAKAVGALNHPNILTVHDVGTHDGSPYVVTELLEGETLREVLVRRAPTTRQVLSWAVQAAHGLSAAHQKGIVHRDIKPENLFLTTDGRVKILDFGLAKLVARTAAETEAATASGPSQAGVIVGTVAYMSPEQVAGRGRGPPLGHLLAGDRPLRASVARAPVPPRDGPGDADGDPPRDAARLSVSQPGISQAVDRIVRRCLEKGRDERFQSAHDLALALEAVLEGGSAAAALLRGRGEEPVPGALVLHRGGRGALLRPRGGGRGAVEKAARAETARRDRTLGRGQDLVRPRGRRGRAAGGLGGDRGDARESRPCEASARRSRPSSPATPRRSGGSLNFEDGETAFELLSRWRRNHDEALVVVDQFEELFTLNPPETQARFAALLGRLAREADVHVLLSLRDDFLMRCHEHEALAPVFESLTPLRPDDARGAAARARRAGHEARLPVRGRGARRRDGRRGRGRARGAAAPGLRRVATLGEARTARRSS